MATRTILLTQNTATNIITAATPALVNGQNYTLQNVGANPIRYAEAATAPARASGHIIKTGESWVITISTTTPAWVFALNGDSQIALSEAS